MEDRTRIEKMVDDTNIAFVKGKETEVHLGYKGDKAGTYGVSVQNQILNQLLMFTVEMRNLLGSIHWQALDPDQQIAAELLCKQFDEWNEKK